MPKLTVGQEFPDLIFDTPFRKGLNLKEESAGKKTVVLFLRYYGCTLCQLDIHNLKENYQKILEKNAQVFVVLQSDPNKIASELKSDDLPFEIICDPSMSLYERFEIIPAKSIPDMLSPKAMTKVAEAKQLGFTHGDYEGNEQQLPATFIFDKDMKITYARYGKDVADIPDVDELVTLL